MRLKKLNIVFVILFAVISVAGQSSAVIDSNLSSKARAKKQILPLNEVREGMTGTAYTVFRGTQAEPFNVEIIGVLPNGIGPKQDMIVGKISGGKADRTQVFAGMSGSPVYINGKLAGAIAYAFPFSKEAICGITPIEQMVSMFEKVEKKADAARTPRSYSFAELAADEWKPNYNTAATTTGIIPYGGTAGAAFGAISGQSFRRISTPLSFNGFTQKTLDLFAPHLNQMGLLPVSGVSSGSGLTKLTKSDETTLVGGDSVSVALACGDFSIMASGTVTLRDESRIYAFGHPFLSLGAASLPMSESSVVIVVPNLNNSFKMAVSENLVGSMTQDLATGIYGNLGESPKMIPVKLNIQTSRNRKETLNFEIADDQLLTPLILNMTVFNAIVANERSLGEMAISIDGRINLKDHESIKISGRYAGQLASRLATNAVLIPAYNLSSSKFSNLKFTGIELTIVSSNESKSATLQRMTVDRAKASPGETIEVEAFIRTDTGQVMSQKIPFTIPKDTPYGKLKITVGDGSTMQDKSVEKKFVPATLADLVDTINKVKKNDRLYLQAKRITTGAVIGSNEMPNLPPSVLATLNTSRTSSVYQPTLESIVAEIEIPRAQYVIVGLQELEIVVVD
jgi:hypothetical protein